MSIQIFASVPPGPDNTIGPGPQNAAHNPPEGYKITRDTNPEIGQVAVKLLGGEWGTTTPFEIDGKNYLARVEAHPPRPGGIQHWHKGVTIYEPFGSSEEH